MKFYRVHLYDVYDSSAGFEWFTSMREARKAASAYDKTEIEIIEVAPTKQGILSALNVYAIHPDNG